jgi:hypothetical protein
MTSWNLFLSTVLPEEGIGYYCIGSYKKGTPPITYFADTIKGTEELVQKVLDAERDVFFGVSKFVTDKNRKASNAGWVKAFFLDLDCGQKYADEGKGYLTQAEALLELKRFCNAIGLPRPNIVNSGNGVHASWVLTESLEVKLWKETATLFKRQAVQQGLKIDPTKVMDLAMVLRVPDTLNFKSNPPKEVKWVSEAEPIAHAAFKKFVSKDLEPEGLDLKKAPKRPMDETTRALLGNNVTNFGDIMKNKSCLQLNHIYKNQHVIEEPLWRAGLSIAQACEDRDTAIHKLSEKHPDYSWKDTENKANDTKGPYHCTTIEGYNPKGCDGCEHKGKITSPIQLHKRIAKATAEDNVVTLPCVEIGGEEVTYTIPEFPFPYFRGRNGGVYKQGFTKDDGEEVQKDELIFKHDFYIVKRMHDPELGEMVWMRLHLPKDGVREFSCPAIHLMSSEKFKDVVGKHGVFGNPAEMVKIMNYITDFAKALLERNEAETMRTQFGWCDDDRAFILGDREITGNGVRYSPPSNTTLEFVSLFKPKGTLDDWKRVVDVYGRPGQEARAFLFFAGLGAPLLKFTNYKGLIYSLTENESAGGKTTLQRVINSIWGHPVDMMLIARDTLKSQFHQMGVYNNISICTDEVTNMSNEAVSTIAYGVSQGRSNNRMKANSNELRINNTRWSLPAFFSGNSSMHEKIAALKSTPESEQLRIVEVEIPPDHTLSKEFTDEIFEHVLMENYGVAANPLLEYVVSSLPEIKVLLRKTQLKFDAEAGLKQKQRFYSAGASTAFTMAIIAKQLGLHNIEVDRVWEWAVKYFSELRESVKPANKDALSHIGSFLNAHMRNLLVVDDTNDKRTGLTKAPLQEPYGDLIVRFEPDTNFIFIDSDILAAWCVEKQISYRNMTRSLIQMGAGGSIGKKAMAKGTALNTPSVNALKIDNSVLDLVDPEQMKPKTDDIK